MKFISVYNAKSGAINAAMDMAHKILRPSTYDCDLCQLTHGTLGPRQVLKDFQKSFSHELEFYHIDEFEDLYPERYVYPVVLVQHSDHLEVLLNSKAIAQLIDVNDLIRVLTERVSSQ